MAIIAPATPGTRCFFFGGSAGDHTHYDTVDGLAARTQAIKSLRMLILNVCQGAFHRSPLLWQDEPGPARTRRSALYALATSAREARWIVAHRWYLDDTHATVFLDALVQALKEEHPCAALKTAKKAAILNNEGGHQAEMLAAGAMLVYAGGLQGRRG